METKEKDKLKEKREFYQYLKELGLEPKLDRELQAEKEEKTAKENMQKILNKHNDSKRIKKIGGNSEQKVLKTVLKITGLKIYFFS